MPASKADQVQKEKRIEQAVKAILDGERVPAVVAALQDQYGIAESTAYEYTKEATSRIYQKIEGTLEEKINRHYQRLERLYAKCLKDNDKRTARMVLKDMADLMGLDAPKRTDLTSNGETLQPPVFLDVLGVDSDKVIKPKKPEKKEEEPSDVSTSDGEAEPSNNGNSQPQS